MAVSFGNIRVMEHDAQRWPLLAAVFSRFGRPVVLIDLESTGGHFYDDRITEIAFLRFSDGLIRRHQWLVNPEMPISAFITHLTGIDDAMVADAPSFAALADGLLPLLRGSLLAAHNSKFDYTFLRHAFGRAGIDFAAHTLCTVQLSRRLYPQFYRHNLDSIIERFGLTAAARHRAFDDVAALADFLEAALREHGSTAVAEQIGQLIQPRLPPSDLSAGLHRKIGGLPDGFGVSLWFNHAGEAVALHSHAKAFSDISALLHNKRLPLRQAADFRFIPACGPLHAFALKVQWAQAYGFRPSENPAAPAFFTVAFKANEHQEYQARIQVLADGRRQTPPNGLFAHKKAAKRALNEWAAQHRLCPALLDILPESHARGVPCPRHAVGLCGGQCGSGNPAEHNRRILHHADTLPVTGWGTARRIKITETDPLSGRSITLHCAGGALQLPDGGWYFDRTLPPILHEKFKRGLAEDVEPAR
ncbi:exonuclease domain-containing protein [Neisseria leonii]|uniref:DNA-directed DNA polymerase n=2 Tax=Neisseria leonii TaxID=2995413 RepID=A0A9X4E0U2_9NEIS|nr:exonuclease domain-containing protein [Neisseria sp. 51.81]MDD9327408.1 exonuclease domain-containing protein [Neisseria sp. 51.81]